MLTLLKASAGKPFYEAWYFWIGLIAAVCIAIFSMPQLIKTLKSKHTEGLSVAMLCLLVFGDFMFLLDGIGMMIDNNIAGGLPLFLANVIADASSAILLGLKLRSLHWAKKFQTTEKQFCDNYEAYKTKIKMLKAEKEAAKKVEVPSDPNQPIAG